MMLFFRWVRCGAKARNFKLFPKEDCEIHEYFRAQNLDFKGTGYDRGHLAAAANHRKSPTVLQETFLLSNICPQHPGLNRKLWKRLEIYTRSLAKHFNAVYVCSGPLYLPKQKDDKLVVEYQLLGTHHIAVPTHFFKIILMESQDWLETFNFHNNIFCIIFRSS